MRTILKFGGTSVQDTQAMRRLGEIVATRSGERVVIVSALAKVTDALVKLSELCEQGSRVEALSLVDQLEARHEGVARDLNVSFDSLKIHFSELKSMVEALSVLKEVSPRSRDAILSTGELCSSRLVALSLGSACEWFDARQGVVTSGDFGVAKVNFPATREALQSRVATILKSKVVLSQGFIGATEQGATTTLGRGGSDYSAAVFGASLDADKVEIWTDVSGILSTDPRIVPEARVLERIHFTEAAEMAYFGAKVLHPATIYPALERKIPVWILNSKEPAHHGTEISFETSARARGLCGITFKRNISLLNIQSTRMLGAHGFLKSVFDVFAKHSLSVDLIATSEVSVSLTLDPQSDRSAIMAVQKELSGFADVSLADGKAMVSVIGGGIKHTPGLAARIFSQIEDVNVQMISMGASELNISFVVDGGHCDDVVSRLHKSLLN